MSDPICDRCSVDTDAVSVICEGCEHAALDAKDREIAELKRDRADALIDRLRDCRKAEAAERERDAALAEVERLRSLLRKINDWQADGTLILTGDACDLPDKIKSARALAQHQPVESDYGRGRQEGPEEAAYYLFSNEYIHLLERAIAARLATTLNNEHKHTKALELVQAAICAKAQEGRDDG